MKESFYSWNEYSFKFTERARDLKVSPEKILELLNYAGELSERKIPIIYDIKHLSFHTGYREAYITRAIKNTSNFYRKFEIAKKDGNKRIIYEPLPGLKEIQYWILNNIIKTVPLNRFNNAYAQGKSIVSNAKFHTKQPQVLNIDIEKFFDNITFEMVISFFSNMGYNYSVSNTLSLLCTLNGSIPQGSPSSPYLSSVLTAGIDDNIFKYCRELNLRYSRYADDITISGDFHAGKVINDVKLMLESLNFRTNDTKTRVKKQSQRQMVTGIVVNRKLSVRKIDLKAVRQAMFYINKYGIESHAVRINLDKSNYISHLLGRVNFFLFVKKENGELLRYKKQLIELLKQDESNEY